MGECVPFVVMELLRGQSLASRLSAGALSPDLTLRVCTEIAGALAVAHAQGLVHRDVKPGDVILTASGAKVFVFGIAAWVVPFALTETTCWATRVSSVIEMVDSSEVPLMRLVNSPADEGTTRRAACGSTMRQSVSPRLIPSDRPAST